MLALLRGGKLDLPHGSIHAHGKRRQGRTDAGFEKRVRTFEDPRITECAAPDHRAVRAGIFEDAYCVLRDGDIAVGDDGDGDRLPDRTDRVPVSTAAVLLRTGAAVNRDGGCAGLLRHTGEFDAVDAFLVPSLAEFDGNGDVHGLDDRFDDARGERQVAHERRAVAVAGDLRSRTAHVDVDDVAAGFFERDARALRHGLRFVAEDLRGGRMLVRRKLEQTRRFPVLIAQRLGRDHLGHGQSRAVLAADAAEGEVGHACHRREYEPSVNFYRSDLHSVPPDLIYGLFYHNITGNATCRMVTERK